MKNITIGNVYAGLTVLFTLFLTYLKLYENYPIPWVWVTVTLWGSLMAGFAFIGLCWVIVYYWGNDKTINGGNDETTED